MAEYKKLRGKDGIMRITAIRPKPATTKAPKTTAKKD